jgi:hypothetical protein
VVFNLVKATKINFDDIKKKDGLDLNHLLASIFLRKIFLKGDLSSQYPSLTTPEA